MIGAIAHWAVKAGISMSDARHIYQRFDYVCRGFQVDKLAFVDADETFPLSVPEEIVGSLEEALALFPGCTPVYLDKNGPAVMAGYKHPADAVYIVGPDYGAMSVPSGAACLRIDLPDPVIEFWADQVLLAVLAHRYVVLEQ